MSEKSSLMTTLEHLSQSKTVPQFIVKLYTILERHDYNKIICWSEDNSEVQIKNPRKLEEVILPQYFRHSKAESFIRQLNMYGFTKRNKLTHRNSLFFRNESFRKGDVEALPQIKRNRKVKNTADETRNGSVQQQQDEACQKSQLSPDIKEEPSTTLLIRSIDDLAGEITKLSQSHPQLRVEMQRIIELTNRVQQSCGLAPYISTRELPQPSLPNMFQTVREMPPCPATNKSVCSFGQEAEESS